MLWKQGGFFTSNRDKIFISVQFSRSVMSDPLQPHEPQHARPPCPSPTPGVHPNPCPSSWWCHPTISSSVVPFSCLQSFSASGSFPVNWLFEYGGQSIGASASVLPMNIQDWFPLGLTDLISLLSTSLLQHHSSKTLSMCFLDLSQSPLPSMSPDVTFGVKSSRLLCFPCSFYILP